MLNPILDEMKTIMEDAAKFEQQKVETIEGFFTKLLGPAPAGRSYKWLHNGIEDLRVNISTNKLNTLHVIIILTVLAYVVIGTYTGSW